MSRIDDILGGVTQTRTAVIEDVDTDTNEILIKAAPYEVETDIGGGITEVFSRGTFARSAKAPQRLGVWNDHGGPLVGRGIEVDDRPDGVWIRAKLSQSRAAQEMVQDIKDGILTDPSIEFRPIAEEMEVRRTKDGIHVRHRRGHLRGVAMVAEGAYGEHAFVASVRDAQREREAEKARLWLTAWRNADPFRGA